MTYLKNRLKEMLIENEGLKVHPYKCTAGKLTIGIGRNIESNGITVEEALFLLDNDINRVMDELYSIFGISDFKQMPGNVQIVLCDMCFNLGVNRFLDFKKMIEAVKKHDWKEMVIQMQDSNWYHQVGDRSKKLVKIIKQLY